MLHVDGEANNEEAGVGIILISLESYHVQSATHFAFKASNNDAEYEAFIIGLKLALEMKVKIISVHSDSMLVVSQVNGGTKSGDLRQRCACIVTYASFKSLKASSWKKCPEMRTKRQTP